MKKYFLILFSNLCLLNSLQAQIFTENFENFSPYYGTNVTSSAICPSISFENNRSVYPFEKIDCLAKWKTAKGTPSIGNENGNSFLSLWSQNLPENGVLKTFSEEVYIDGYRLEPNSNYRLVYYIKASFDSNEYATFNVNLTNGMKPYYYKNMGSCGTVLTSNSTVGNLDSYRIPNNGNSDWVMRTVYFSTENEQEYFLSFMPYVWEGNNPSKQLNVQLDNVQIYKDGSCDSKTVSIQNKIISPRIIYPVVKAKRIYAGRSVVASSITPFGDVVVKPNGILNLKSTFLINLDDGFIVEEGGLFDASIEDGCYSVQAYKTTEEEVLNSNAEDNNTNLASQFFIYPNPVNGPFTISSDVRIDEVIIYNPIGQIVKNIRTHKKENKVEINFTSLDKGIYLVKIRSGQEWVEQKVIVE